MEQLTQQDIFNTVYVHLLIQNKASAEDPATVAGVGSCLYRGPNGLKCAVGAVITDEEYTPKMEGTCEGGGNVKSIHDAGLLPARLVPHIQFLTSLQSVHDHFPPTEWKDRLNGVARMYNLTIPSMK